MLVFRKTLRTLLRLIIAGGIIWGAEFFRKFSLFLILRSFLLCVHILFLEVLPEPYCLKKLFALLCVSNFVSITFPPEIYNLQR